MGFFDSKSSSSTTHSTETLTDESITDLANAQGSSVYKFDFSKANLSGGAVSTKKSDITTGGMGGSGGAGLAGGAGGSINIGMTDYGAIAGGLGLAGQSIDTVQRSASAAINAAQASSKETIGAVLQAAGADSRAMWDKLQVIIIAAVIGGVIIAIKRG